MELYRLKIRIFQLLRRKILKILPRQKNYCTKAAAKKMTRDTFGEAFAKKFCADWIILPVHITESMEADRKEIPITVLVIPLFAPGSKNVLRLQIKIRQNA